METRVRYARTADGVDIAYTVAGDGPLLLVPRPVLRGAVNEAFRGLDAEFDALAALARQRAVGIWDYRGSGLSDSVTPAYSLETALLDMEAVADAVAQPSFDVLGMLMPCHTAIAYAAGHPDRVRRLVLWNPALPASSPRKTSFADVPDIAREHFADYMNLAALRFIGWENAATAQKWVATMLARFTPETWLNMMESIEAIDCTSLGPSISSPTLAMIDYNSAAYQIKRATNWQHYIRRLAASIPNGELAVLKEGDSDAFVAVVNAFLDVPEPGDAKREAPSGTAIILFADIVDSTALTERMGDAAFRAKARNLDDALRAIIRDNGGAAIDGKLLGDGVLATFPAASQAVAAALRCAASGNDGGLPLHLGIHAGDVMRESNNVFGGAVNIASRISALSAPGEVLVSRTVADLARTSAGVTFEDRGEHALKGIAEPQRVFAVRKAGT